MRYESWMITEKQEKKDQIFKQIKHTRKLK